MRNIYLTIILITLRTISSQEITPCIDSNQCKSQNCIQVCNTNSDIKQACGDPESIHQLPQNFFKVACFDLDLKQTQYLDYNEMMHRYTTKQKPQKVQRTQQQRDIPQPPPNNERSQQQTSQREIPQKEPSRLNQTNNEKLVFGLGIGMACKIPYQCKSKNCINLCDSNTDEKVCGVNVAKDRPASTTIQCFDTVARRTKTNDDLSLQNISKETPVVGRLNQPKLEPNSEMKQHTLQDKRGTLDQPKLEPKPEIHKNIPQDKPAKLATPREESAARPPIQEGNPNTVLNKVSEAIARFKKPNHQMNSNTPPKEVAKQAYNHFSLHHVATKHEPSNALKKNRKPHSISSKFDQMKFGTRSTHQVPLQHYGKSGFVDHYVHDMLKK